MRFGVLGTGFWAKEVHARALAEHPSAELVGVWGRDLAKAKAVGAEFDVPGYGDVDELLAEVDAVTLDEVNALAAKLLSKPMSLAVVGPFDENAFSTSS